VVYSDVIQTGILVFGILLCIFFAMDTVGGLETILAVLPDSRRQAIDWSSGLQGAGGAPFWAFVLGGFFLYTADYGTDQRQVQRELSARTTAETGSAWPLIYPNFEVAVPKPDIIKLPLA
jgi:Na+/proline symporter